MIDRVIGRQQPVLVSMDPLRQVDTAVWVLEGVQRMSFGLHEPVRMTVLCLAGDQLLLHSPLPIDPETHSALSALGRVCWVVAPNVFHHLYVLETIRRWPDARLLSVPGLVAKRPELPVAAELPSGTPIDWSGELEVAEVGPVRGFREVVLFHRPSRTLVVTDLVFHLTNVASAFDRLVWRVNGVYGCMRPTLLLRVGGLWGATPATMRLAQVLDWDFARVIMAHGTIVERDAQARFRTAFAALLDDAGPGA